MRPFTSFTERWRILNLAEAARRRRWLTTMVQRRRLRVLARQISRKILKDLPDREFIKTYRLDKESVKTLVKKLEAYIPRPKRSDSISTEFKVLIALSFYASGSYQTLVGQSAYHNVSQTTVSRAVSQVTRALNMVYGQYIKWPSTLQERNKIKSRFYSRFRIPGVLGVIDGTHVAILRPEYHEERYFNRKGFHSLNVSIICDADLNITCVDASSPGSAHDSTVWQSHPLSRHLCVLSNAGEQVFLLGDSAYPLRTTMMTPILNTTGTPEHFYYMCQVTARNTIERCIRVLKARFRCLLTARALHYSPTTAGNIVNACCILHNIANKKSLPLISLTAAEIAEERAHQIQTENQLREMLNNLDRRDQRVNPDLQRGRALQQALVAKLWADR